MKKSFLLLTISLLALHLSVFSQSVEPSQWTFSAVKVNDSVAELQLTAKIEPHWHIYAMSHNNGVENPISFSFKPSPNYVLIGKTTEPSPKTEEDEMFGTSRFFEKSVVFKQKIAVKSPEPFEVKGTLSGQVCIEGRCQALEKKFAIKIEGFDKVKASELKEDTSITDKIPVVENNDAQATKQNISSIKDKYHKILVDAKTEEEQSLWKFILFAFLGGLAGLLMPCVFPMIPMTVSFFMKSKNSKFDATLYGISIVVIFVLIGIILSLIFGAGMANIISTHWLPNILFAIIFVLFAISLLGYFEITLPSKWVNKSAKMENTGGVIGIFFMALTLVLVSFSCTLPIAGAVALTSADGTLLKPVIGMLFFSLGIAIPFTLFAYFPCLLKNMPKSGGWMTTLKVVLAFVELAFALKFLNVPDQTYHWGILDREVYLSIWIVLFTMLGFYLLGKLRFPHDEEHPVQKNWFRYLLSIGVFSFTVYLVPGLFGAPLKAISGWLPPVPTQDFDISTIVREETAHLLSLSQQNLETPKYAATLHIPHGIKGYFDYDQALAVAKKLNKPVFIDFTGHGCVNCRKVESAVWVDNRVRQLFAEELVVAALYVDDKTVQLDPEDRLLDLDGDTIFTLGAKNMLIQNYLYKENSQPCYFVVDVDGNVLSGATYYEMNADKYLKFLNEGIERFNHTK